MSWRVRDSIEQLRALSFGLPDDEFDPYLHAVRDEPPELEDDDAPSDDFCRAMWDPNTGQWLDA